MRRGRPHLAVGGLALAILLVYVSPGAVARPQPAPDAPEQGQVLTQGPIHEAFASPVLFDPKPGPVVPKAPPAPINEVPPDQKPAGDDVQWIPGYWAWDDTRNDFIWVSGVWRKIPPDRQWVPGYWRQVEGGSQWVPGYWGQADATQAQYLPEPPASVEQGPTAAPPTATSTWVPGMWTWQDNQYAWRPGFWVDNQPGWMWTPASYSWTPSGYVFNQGFWDYPMGNRGIPFAPTYFRQRNFSQPGFMYSPAVRLLSSALLSSLFVRPAYSSYYFGDYYAPNNFQSGIYPWYAFHGSRYGYDPLYAYTAAQNLRTDPNWANNLHQVYQYRSSHPEARPPRTFAETWSIAARPTPGGTVPEAARNLVLASPLSQRAAAATGVAQADALRLERIDQARRQEFARQARDLHQYRENRARQELAGGTGKAQPGTGKAQPTRVTPPPREAPRPPSVAARRNPGQPVTAPPAPRHPEFDRAIRPPAAGAAPSRREPRLEAPAPAQRVAPAPAQPGSPRRGKG